MQTAQPLAPTPPALLRAVWFVVILLALIGVTAAMARARFPADLATNVEPFRTRILASLRITDPFAADRPAELLHVDGRFAAHRLLTLLHVVPGGILLLFAPLQFSARVRNRYRQLHRWSGRALIGAGIVVVLPALFFGVAIPYGGPAEAIAIALIISFFLFAVCTAFLAIRRHQVARHREWMIRAFALLLAISTVRVIASILDATLTPAGFRPPEIFVISIWTGWILTLGAAEMWIRLTRPRMMRPAAP